MLTEWQVRLIEERSELDVRVAKLHNWIIDSSTNYHSLLEGDKELLRRQLHHMSEYAAILRQRVDKILSSVGGT